MASLKSSPKNPAKARARGTDSAEGISWNISAKNVEVNADLQRRLLGKVAKLERHLAHFPHDAMHLQIALERHHAKPLCTAGLTLRLPSNILHSEKSAGDIMPAVDAAVKAL